MENVPPTSGFTPEATRSDTRRPHTPPYTPACTKGKRRLERSDSPASVSSIHPVETTSPAKKTARRALQDSVKVEELAEGDVGYHTDLDVVYPEELEEVDSTEGDDGEPSDSGTEHSDTGTGSISRRMSRMRCSDEEVEAKFQQNRRQRRLSKRIGSRLFKRTHSQSAKSDTEVTDADAMDDQDLAASQRRLRRRTRGPGDAVLVFDDLPLSSEATSHHEDNLSLRSSRPVTPTPDAKVRQDPMENDAMEVDNAG